MGQGLFAKNDIKRGEIIFAERPLLVFPDLPLSQKNLSGFEMLLEAAIARLSPESQADFRALHNNYTSDQYTPLRGIGTSNNYDLRNLFDGLDQSSNYKIINKIASRINHRCVLDLSAPTTHLTLLSAVCPM
jgi:hypothetical protein